MRLLVLLFLTITSFTYAQQKPKLVVGIIVDQMRQEYIYRYGDRFSDNGFKKLINEGYQFKNTHYNYVPTYTAPGHTSVYTGTTPAYHGILGNDFYDRKMGKEVYCADDFSENTVGSDTEKGKMSPRRMLTTTITDELRLSNLKKSKVIGLSIKDRGAIFPAGHLGEAYWYDRDAGVFITSTYYREHLPEWVKDYNARKRADYYLNQTWEPLYPLDTYINSISDSNNYEKWAGPGDPHFPLKMDKDNYDLITESPFGNEMLTEISIDAINKTDLGEDQYTDFLAISFSATDYVGHGFGPTSVELEDTYLRLDKNIAALIAALDKKIGKGNYLIFLTSDHAVADVPLFFMDNKIPSGYFDGNQRNKLETELVEKLGQGQWILDISNNQVFLNRQAIREAGKDLNEIQDLVAQRVLEFEGVAYSYPAHEINLMDYNAGGIKGMMVRGYHQKLSGDVLFSFYPSWLWRSSKGSTHGSAFTYDTHVPLIWYGANIPHGFSVKKYPITNIAATLSMMLNIKLPSGATGQPLEELFVK